MRWQAIGYRAILLLGAFVALLSGPPAGKAAQQQIQQAGIVVDAQGVLSTRLYTDPLGQLTRQRIAAAKASLAPDVVQFSKLRKISLNRLEQAIRHNNGALTDQMRYLAGLLRIRYVFCYPESRDIVLAGPAEGWMTDFSGRVVGITSGRPVMQLQDLIVALRAFPPGGDPARLIGCSIDPTQEGLAEMARFLRSVGSYTTPAHTQNIANGLRTSLGMQTISIDGVPPGTHFAQVMVEADYRMKLIGIGLERPPVRLVSFVERANPTQVARNALFRWFFTPDYNCVRASEDWLAMELVGDGVKLVGEDELVSAGGVRQAVTRSNAASRAFVTSFTKHYCELADRSSVYAELRNLIDLAVAAAYMQQQDFYGKIGWKMELFGSEEALAVQTHNAPKTVQTAVNAVWKGNRLMTPIGGGVQINALMALEPENLLEDENDQVGKLRNDTTLQLTEGQWWWD